MNDRPNDKGVRLCTVRYLYYKQISTHFPFNRLAWILHDNCQFLFHIRQKTICYTVSSMHVRDAQVKSVTENTTYID